MSGRRCSRTRVAPLTYIHVSLVYRNIFSVRVARGLNKYRTPIDPGPEWWTSNSKQMVETKRAVIPMLRITVFKWNEGKGELRISIDFWGMMGYENEIFGIENISLECLMIYEIWLISLNVLYKIYYIRYKYII